MKDAINILIIDDSKIDRLIVRSHFTYVFDKGNIQEADNGEDALHFLENCQEDFPDLILVDINMPILNGFEFLERYEEVFWRQHPRTLIYIISSSKAKIDREKSNGFASVQGLLTKPLVRETAKSLHKAVLHVNQLNYGTSPS